VGVRVFCDQSLDRCHVSFYVRELFVYHVNGFGGVGDFCGGLVRNLVGGLAV